MADIFLSYDSEDRDRVCPLVQALEQSGWSVWWDRTIPAGKVFDEIIEEAITNTHCVVVVWTERSVLSNWVREEAEVGLQRGVLIPVFLDSVQAPLGFRRIQGAELIAWDGTGTAESFQKLMTDIKAHLRPRTEREATKHDAVIPAVPQPSLTDEESLIPKPQEIGPLQNVSLLAEPQSILKEPPITESLPTRRTRTSKQRLWRNPGIIAAIIGAVAVLMAALLPSVLKWQPAPPPKSTPPLTDSPQLTPQLDQPLAPPPPPETPSPNTPQDTIVIGGPGTLRLPHLFGWPAGAGVSIYLLNQANEPSRSAEVFLNSKKLTVELTVGRYRLEFGDIFQDVEITSDRITEVPLGVISAPKFKQGDQAKVIHQSSGKRIRSLSHAYFGTKLSVPPGTYRLEVLTHSWDSYSINNVVVKAGRTSILR